MLSVSTNDSASQQCVPFLKNTPLTCNLGSFCSLESACEFVNTKLVIVEF